MARTISVVTTETCFGEPLSGSDDSSSVRNRMDLVMYLVLLFFKTLEQVRILLLGLSTLIPPVAVRNSWSMAISLLSWNRLSEFWRETHFRYSDREVCWPEVSIFIQCSPNYSSTHCNITHLWYSWGGLATISNLKLHFLTTIAKGADGNRQHLSFCLFSFWEDIWTALFPHFLGHFAFHLDAFHLMLSAYDYFYTCRKW